MRDEPNENGSQGSRRPRVGLALGAGGVLGAAWLTGALHALSELTGWDPRSADYIVGTSAGSAVGALVAAGVSPQVLADHQRGTATAPADGGPGVRGEDGAASGRVATWEGKVPRPVLGSPGLVLRSALRPWRYPPTALLVGWMGRGFMSTERVGRLIRTVVGDGWSDHPNLWVVAVDYGTGRRTVFGRPGAPETDLYRAVQASCAIPGLYEPVRIDDGLYVDGGAWSPSNLDLLARERLDLVIALNPMSTLHPRVPTTILERAERGFRSMAGRRLGREARRLRSTQTPILLIQPRERDLSAMGVNLMNARRRRTVLDTAIETTRQRLAGPEARGLLEALPRLRAS